MCGRLLCCLGYEYEVYRVLNENMPKVGTVVRAGQKSYSVEFTDPLNESIRLRCDDHMLVVKRSDLSHKDNEYRISQDVLKRVSQTLDEELEEELVK
jgi:cell fate regulator YaaT (PSP1 superfamily)